MLRGIVNDRMRKEVRRYDSFVDFLVVSAGLVVYFRCWLGRVSSYRAVSQPFVTVL